MATNVQLATHVRTHQLVASDDLDADADDRDGSNPPKSGDPDSICEWEDSYGSMKEIQIGIEGDELLELDLGKLYVDPWRADEKLRIKEEEKLFRDRILWVKTFLDTQNRLPSEEETAQELEISTSKAQVVLDLPKGQKKDLNELLLDLNVRDDAVIWWNEIVNALKTVYFEQLMFGKVAELTSANVAIQLLEKFKVDLTRFSADKLDKLSQNIVIGSQFPVCTSLRIAKWFFDRANYDVSRADKFKTIAQSYIDAATEYIALLESDHLATIMLEVKSDIEGLSALDMALKYDLQAFVANNRIERVTTSIMNNFEFLKPENRDEAFEIDPLSIDLVWKKLQTKTFYFTPLGLFTTRLLLYLIYLVIFTRLSVLLASENSKVYDGFTWVELFFWVLNGGYILNEVQAFIQGGFRSYIGDRSNYFDMLISLIFILELILRNCAVNAPQCIDSDDHSPATICETMNDIWRISWGFVTIALWLRLVTFCVLSHSLGPMVQMIFRMMKDVAVFFAIMIIIFTGFTFAVFFVADSHDGFTTPVESAVTLLTGVISDFDFDGFSGSSDDPLYYFSFFVVVLYLLLASIILLNLLIAMMATTYERIDEDTTTTIVYARFKLALRLDSETSFMPPPLSHFCIL